jgi:N6-adenosine-specific RNA methylase IME4
LPTLAEPIEIKPIDTRQEIAKVANVSHGTLDKVKVIEAKAPEDVKAKLTSGEFIINQVYQDISKEEKKQERDLKIQEVKQKIESENLVQPNKKYHVIAIDPPWAYNEKGGFSSDDYDANSNRGAVDYPTMTVEQIKKIELPTADDCVLFLWTTHAFLKDSFEILEHWGFDYKATIVWDKVKMGLGRTIRMQVEFCLLAVKGKPIINGSAERDIIMEPRREHSRKPEVFYQMVERMCIGNKLDFVSRQQRSNWDHYGAETNQF